MIRENLEKMRDILRDSQDITDFCQTNYGKKQTVFLGFNPQDPPRKDTAPSLSIVGAKTEKSGTRVKLAITIGIIILNDNISTFPVPNDSEERIFETITYDGFLEAEELREIVEKTVIKSKKFLRPEVESETLQNEVFPLFTSATIINIEEVISSRS